MTQELPIPAVALQHPSVEMIRVWLANSKQHVVLNVGFWEDRGADERSCWGILLADMVHHIANAHRDEYGHPVEDTIDRVRNSFLAELGYSTSERVGSFVAEHLRSDDTANERDSTSPS